MGMPLSLGLRIAVLPSLNIELSDTLCKVQTDESLGDFLQIAFYEQAKQILLGTGYFRDNTVTHFSASFMAVSVMCIVCASLKNSGHIIMLPDS